MNIDVTSLAFETRDKIDFYLKHMVEKGASDLHVKANAIIRTRINGKITPLTEIIFTKEEAITLAKEMLIGRFHKFVEDKSIDFTYVVDDYRFRVNMFFQIDGVSAVFRTIAQKIPTIEELGLVSKIKDFLKLKQGIVLVTGPTGSGKSTTLASMLNEVNHTSYKHIITIEDPIEFVYKEDNCIINQRAIGQDALDFSSSLKSALREDPDIILIGEMRDKETIEMAMHAAETGHLVLSTLHTIDAKETVNRIISMFSPDEQTRVRNVLSSTLKGVISQRLVKTVYGNRIAAMEILINNPRIEALIAEGRDSEISDALEEGYSVYGTRTFDQSLFDLTKDGIITKEEALLNASREANLRLKFGTDNRDDEEDKNLYIGIKDDEYEL